MIYSKKRPSTLQLWLASIDPGLIRLQSAGRAALALLSIWVVLRTGLFVLTGGGGPPIALFGVLSGIVFLLFIIDVRASERLISLWLALIPFAAAFFLASFLVDNFWLNNLVLLLLFYFSFFLRRYGVRAGELTLVTTVGFYLGFLLHPPQNIFPLFFASIVVSALIVTLWLFVIIPYNPVKSLQQSIIAFYHNVARTVAFTRQELDTSQSNNQVSNTLKLQFKRVHLTRRAIEGLFSGAVSPDLWSQSRLNQLQEEMFKTERALEPLIEATGNLKSQLDDIPVDVLHTLKNGLTILEEHLWEVASGERQVQLAEIGETLQTQLQSSLEEKPAGEWAYSVFRVGIVARKLIQSVANIHTIEKTWKEGAINANPTKSLSSARPSVINRPRNKTWLGLHPTSILGLQAVLATGLAMVAAYLLKMDKPNLVYWTAFVVIAGSTGETLRRIFLRVIGVIAGTIVGVLLAVIMPDNLPLVILFVTISIFLTIYSITISYVWMIFWLNIAMLLMLTTLGGASLDLLVVRPVSTLLGATVAALVVVFVLPIHVKTRFIATLTEFLTAVDDYIEIYVNTLVKTSISDDLRAEEINIDSSYKKLELSLPSLAFEYNPLSRVQSHLTSQETNLAVLKDYVTHLGDDVGVESGLLAGANADLIQGIQLNIHSNVTALNEFLTNGKSKKMHSLDEIARQAKSRITLENILTTEAGSKEAARNRAIYQLTRIHDVILQIASSLGMQAD